MRFEFISNSETHTPVLWINMPSFLSGPQLAHFMEDTTLNTA